MQTNQGVNKIILIGYIDKEPRSHAQPGRLYSTLHFPLITSEKIFKNGVEIWVDECHQIKLSGQFEEVPAGGFSKGKMIVIEGKVKTRSFTDADNIKRYKTEICAVHFQLLN